MTAADASRYFSQTYGEARGKFLQAAEAAALDVVSHPHPMLGRDGEALAMDVVREGAADAAALLGDAAWRQSARDAGVALLFVHALNPYGFSWWRRTTHENVDLNRNFHDFSQPLPPNAGYAELASAIVPPTWPPSDDANAMIERYMHRHGQAKLQEAVSGGQYEYPEGIFFGGHDPTWSHVTLRHVLQEQATRCARLGWIDLHTGLGPAGVGERIFACRDDAAALRRARAWWGDKVTSLYDGSSSSAPLQGLMWHTAYQECPQAEYTGIALEYGTLPIMDVINALRADQWLENHPEAPEALGRQIKRQVRDAFYVDNEIWKRQVIDQAVDAAQGAVRGLATR